MGGDSPIKLMRFPGEPAKPPLPQSWFALAAVLADTDVVDKASRGGDTVALPCPSCGGWATGLMLGDATEDEDAEGVFLAAFPFLEGR